MLGGMGTTPRVVGVEPGFEVCGDAGEIMWRIVAVLQDIEGANARP
jgi:hypothetical protein